MISEQDKQAILNGAYGVNGNGNKCKLVFIANNEIDPLPYLVVEQIEDGSWVSNWLTKDLKYSPNRDTDTDIVGLWEEKPEPFDLERALAGEPVKLRGGLKAYIKYVMPCEYKGKYPLNGYIINPKKANDIENYTWTLEGMSGLFEQQHYYDIIGMWKELEPEPKTVTLTLPCPLKEPQNGMWFIGSDGVVFKSDYQKDIPTRTFNKDKFDNEFYFGSKEEAQAWLNALKNNRR